MIARWGRVPNFRFYELQVAVPEDLNAGPDWDLTPIRSITSASDTMPRPPLAIPWLSASAPSIPRAPASGAPRRLHRAVTDFFSSS